MYSAAQTKEELARALAHRHFSASKRKFAATGFCLIATNVPVLCESLYSHSKLVYTLQCIVAMNSTILYTYRVEKKTSFCSFYTCDPFQLEAYQFLCSEKEWGVYLGFLSLCNFWFYRLLQRFLSSDIYRIHNPNLSLHRHHSVTGCPHRPQEGYFTTGSQSPSRVHIIRCLPGLVSLIPPVTTQTLAKPEEMSIFFSL